jgi:hypothetical protein
MNTEIVFTVLGAVVVATTVAATIRAVVLDGYGRRRRSRPPVDISFW